MPLAPRKTTAQLNKEAELSKWLGRDALGELEGILVDTIEELKDKLNDRHLTTGSQNSFTNRISQKNTRRARHGVQATLRTP